jgi:hypothetical protein
VPHGKVKRDLRFDFVEQRADLVPFTITQPVKTRLCQLAAVRSRHMKVACRPK